MKVLFIVEHYHPHVGGGEKLFLDLADALRRNGAEVRVATSDSGGIRGKHAHNGVEIYSYPWFSLFGHPMPRQSDLAGHVQWADVVQTAQYTAAPGALKAARKSGKPCVLMAYEFLGKKWYSVDNPFKATLFRAFEYWVFHKAYDHFIAISAASKRDLLAGGISGDKVSVMYPVFNAFSEWRLVGKSESSRQRIFLYYGRPGKTKGIFTLFDAIQKLDGELSEEVRFKFIVSDDPMEEKQRLKRCVEESGLQRRITVEDSLPLNELIDAVQNAYCVVVPSLTEGFGYSAYQAACMEKNLIVSNAGSLPEVISGNALIFEKGNADSLAGVIRRACANDFDRYQDQVGGDNAGRIIDTYDRIAS